MHTPADTSAAASSPASPEPLENAAAPQQNGLPQSVAKPREIGGPTGPEPTRYGDWERKGRCIDF